MTVLRYLEIKAALMEMISGINCGEKLPNRNKLCMQLDTTRTTLDKAIKELVDQGILKSGKGSGTYVAKIVESIEISGGVLGAY